jgi:AcrR family transcriptional regulator
MASDIKRNMEPVPAGPGEPGWQSYKSSTTRRQILAAAVECVIELGYAATTTTRIAERARLSRGAMLHHFPSKMDVIRAMVDFLHEKRLWAFRKAIPGIGTVEDPVKTAVAAYWSHVTHPWFQAFFDLSAAARHDDDLLDILRPAQKSFNDDWYRTAQELFPEWQSDPAAFDLALNLSQSLMEGMAIGCLTHARPADHGELLALLEEQIRALAPKH